MYHRILLIFLLLPFVSYADICMNNRCVCPYEAQNTNMMIDQSVLIFQGSVVKNIYITPFDYITKFYIQYYWKEDGQESDIIYLKGSKCENECSFDFLEGHHYIVFADKKNGFYYATSCSLTQEVDTREQTRQLITSLTNMIGDPTETTDM